MTILYLIPQLPVDIHAIKGGIHSALVNLLSGMKNKHVNIIVLSFCDKKHDAGVYAYAPNITIYQEFEGNFPLHSLNYLFHGNAIVRRYIRQFRPDVIHFEEGHTFLFVRLFQKGKRNDFLTIHSIATEEAKTKVKKLDRLKWIFNGWMQRYLLPDRLICLSQWSAMHLPAYAKQKQVSVIPNAIAVHFFDLPVKRSFGKKIIFIGVLNERKNLMQVLKSMRSLKGQGKHYELDVLGGFVDDEYRKAVQSFIAVNQLDHDVKLKGWVSQPEVLSHLQQADILVLPSKQETLPMVIAEAMAAGKVVVASNVGGIPHQIEHGKNGFVFDLQRPDDFTKLLSDLYQNQNLMMEISASARMASKLQQHADVVAQQTLELYNKYVDA